MSFMILRSAMLPRVARANVRFLGTQPTRSVLNLARSALPVAAKQNVPHLHLQPATIRYISEEKKAKVNARTVAVKASSTIEERVMILVAEQLGVRVEEVTNGKSFVDDLGADSLDTVELIMALEQEFETEIPDEEAEKITTVQAAIDYVNFHDA